LNVHFVRALSFRLPASSPTVITNAIDPGYCLSEFRRNFTGLKAIFDRLSEKILAFTTEEGSRQLVWGALAEDKEIRGAYISGAKVVEPSDFVLENGTVQERLWDELTEILSKIDPRVQRVVEEYLKTAGA